MYPVKKIFDIILIPFEFIGDIFVFIGNLIRILLVKFFRSVWGFIVPASILLAIAMAFFVAQNQRDLAADYAAQLMVCDDGDVERLVGLLRSLDVAGLVELVNCLRSDREKIFFTCCDAIDEELKKLPNSPDEKNRDKIYLAMTGAMLQLAPQLKPVAKNAVNQFVQQIMTDLVNIKSNGRSHNLQLATMNCEKIHDVIEPTLQQIAGKISESQKTKPKTIARYRASNFHDELLAANGKPFKQTLQDNNKILDNREYLADNSTPQKNYNEQLDNPIPPIPNPKLNYNEIAKNTNQNILTNLPNDNYYQSADENSFPILPKLDATNNKIASQYNHHYENFENQPPEKIDDNAAANTHKKRTKPEKFQHLDIKNPFDNYDDADYFLPVDLRNINLNRVSSLPTNQLMRLLQHPDSNYVLEARRTLIARDGFGNEHLSLAYKLYHYNPAVRKEIIAHLSETNGVLVNAWLTELLNDPNNEIRYNAAALLSTSKDPNTRKLLIEKCQHDADTRIVNLINQLKRR
ncbi:MAG: HEAT repeat domain-containing protein [Planctomycetaceae bacterium]|jgi:hypothetical protein|nr:HEAT repeat domain-containing protein [Planctomycetaceae bacterium]